MKSARNQSVKWWVTSPRICRSKSLKMRVASPRICRSDTLIMQERDLETCRRESYTIQITRLGAMKQPMINERAQTRELGGQTEGRKPKNLQVGRLEITEEKARKRARKERKTRKGKKNSELGRENARPQVNAKRLRGGEIDGFRRLPER